MSAVIGPGTTFGRYRVEGLIGRGGMGVVYRATDESLDRPVALKLIAPELAQDDHFRRRFLKEPRLAASLDHPNVIPIYEAGERDGQLYLAMRYVQGSDLGSLLERERTLAPERALRILAQVAGALDAAHRRGLVHRDVKPANILLDEDEHAYLTDFGISKQAGGASTDTGQAVGTLDYLAPEQIRGEPVDGRSDGYALACVLYECLSGAPPFRRQTQAETLWAHLHEPPPSLPGAPALDPVLCTALAKEKDERYATGAELVDAARSALGLAVPPPVGGSPANAGRRRRRALLAAGLVVLAGTAAAATIVLLPTGGEASDIGLVGNGVAAVDGAGRKGRVVHRVRHGAEQHRRRRGRGLGPEHAGRDGRADRPRDEGRDRQARDARPSHRHRGRGRGAVDRQRRRRRKRATSPRASRGSTRRPAGSPGPSSCPTGRPAATSTRRSTGGIPTSPSEPAPSGRATPTTRSRASTPTPAGCWRRSMSRPTRSRPVARACGSPTART